jgi:hypothetical protein
MRKKSKVVPCTAKHIVDKMWKHWCIKGGKVSGEDNSDNEEETNLAKLKTRSKTKKKVVEKEKAEKARRRRLPHATFAE